MTTNFAPQEITIEDIENIPDEEYESTISSISDSCNRLNSLFEVDINDIDQRISELKTHIEFINNSISKINKLIQTENDPAKRIQYRNAIVNNLRIVCELNDACQKYMSIKLGYRKEQSSITLSKLKLVNVDIPRLKLNSKSSLSDDMSNLIQQLSKLNNSQQTIELQDETYSLK